MSHFSRRGRVSQVSTVVDQMNRAQGLPFGQVLGVDQVEAILHQAGVRVRRRVYDAVTTLWAWLSQAISPDGSCQQAVHRVNAQRVANGQRAASSDTSSYCGARGRLSESALREVTRQTGGRLHQQADPAWLWLGRPVKIIDGTTMTLMDTPANQRAYPQPRSQRAGLGFPIVRAVVVFSLAVGTVLEMALGRHQGKRTGEQSLLRELFETFQPGDIVLGDRLFDNYRDIAALKGRGVDVVFGRNRSRRRDFRGGQVVGVGDRVVTWTRPKFDASRIDRETYEALPATLVIREICLEVHQKGFRPATIEVVTTLIDAAQYPLDQIGELFRQRWHCELDLRSLKAVMGLNQVRCKSPAMARKDIWAHLLAYNLIRVKMAEAARRYGRLPRSVSFKGAMQAIAAYGPHLVDADPARQGDIHAEMLRAIAQGTVGDRPNRSEPRRLKRRQGKYSYLTQPRNNEEPERVRA